jgi:hypothetical protein
MSADRRAGRPLNLRAGEIVEIRSEREILATLDERGELDAMPFMPEMLAFCGQRVRVAKRADKTCDTIERSGGRRMRNMVHLEGLRCDGQAHGGCQAGCFLFWKESWLKRVSEPLSEPPRPAAPAPACERARLVATACVNAQEPNAEPRYRCQATELRRASSPLAWWDVRQYVRDVRSGNVRVGTVLGAFGFWLFRQALKIGAYRALIHCYDWFQRRRGGTPYPFRAGTIRDRTPRETLGLMEGELVRVKPFEEILKTVDVENRNRGLRFDAEMATFCGEVHRVRTRVERIIDEKTGRMLKFSNDCIILEDVVCPAQVSSKRLFCPRSIFPYWREIWLQRVEDAPKP